MSTPQLLTTSEAARRLGITPASLRLAVFRGVITPALKSHAALWFELEEVERYSEARYKHYKPREKKSKNI